VLFAAVAAAIVIGDQLTKAWIVRTIPRGASKPVLPPYFVLYHTQNDGVAWSLFRGHTGLFSLVAAAFSIGIVLLGQRAMRRSTTLAVAIGLLLGGSIGNLIDRVRLHYVVDFLDVWIGHWYHWPTFNVADSAITTGMITLAIYFWIIERQSASLERERDEPTVSDCEGVTAPAGGGATVSDAARSELRGTV